jgi:hypothetical protein
MVSEETLTTNEREEYLYLYEYTIEGKPHSWFDYFKNDNEAKRTILFFNAAAPYIKTVRLRAAPNGIHWRGLHIPYKKSDWKKMLNMQD